MTKDQHTKLRQPGKKNNGLENGVFSSMGGGKRRSRQKKESGVHQACGVALFIFKGLKIEG